MNDTVHPAFQTGRVTRDLLHNQDSPQVAARRQVERGPSGLVRKNPHQAGFIGPNGIKRIDRLASSVTAGHGHLGRNTGGSDNAAAAASDLPLHIVENPDFYILVVPDLVGGSLGNHDRDVFGLARRLADGYDQYGAVVALILGELKENVLDRAGVDRVLYAQCGADSVYNPEWQTQQIFAAVARFTPRHIVFPDSVYGGAELGRRLAARLGERPACGVWKVSLEEQGQVICRAGGGHTDITRSLPRVLLAQEECAEPVTGARHESRPVEPQAVAASSARVVDRGLVEVDPNAISLSEAPFILAGGNGVGDWELFHHAARVLGATEGASRVAVDEGHMPRSRQVGATGTWVSARVYIAVGISGAIQHLQGVEQCGKVVAVNIDDRCDMVKRADLSVIAPADEVLQALVSLVNRYRAGEIEDVT